MKSKNPKITLKVLKSVNNPSSMHGIYPYRGKISALDAADIISQLPSEGTLLDPFCGSGTIVYEAMKHGLKAVGVDNNPLAVQIAKAKVDISAAEFSSVCAETIEKAKSDLERKNYHEMPESARKSFHPQTAAEIMCVKNHFDGLGSYLKGVFCGAVALSARGCNGYMWTSSTVGKNIEPKTYINFFDKFAGKAKKHSKYLLTSPKSEASIIRADSRNLSEFIEENSIDFVFTSPPYFDGLDYTAYYGKLIYDIFGEDRVKIKQSLIQSAETYRADMEAVIGELEKVTTKDALIIFVVGDKKVKNKIINGGEFFNGIRKASYIAERGYSGTSSQVFDVLNKTERKEQIVVWDKRNGEVITYEK